MITVEPGNPQDPQPRALLEQSHALMRSLFPAEACHFLDIDALCAPHVLFFNARRRDWILGTGALALQDGYGEVKSMFTAPEARGQGIGAAVLRIIEDTAREAALPALMLETGAGLDAAHRLYERHGFTPCGPFGGYTESVHSLFYQKALA